MGFPVRGLPRLCLSFRQRRRRKNIRGSCFLNSKEDGHDRVWQESSLPFSKTTSRPPSLPKMKNSHPCYESAVKRNLRSLVDRHEPGESESLSVLFCQLILRAFIESLYLIARTRRSGGQSSLRSLTYHRSLVVDRSTSSPIVKDRLFECNEIGTFKK